MRPRPRRVAWKREECEPRRKVSSSKPKKKKKKLLTNRPTTTFLSADDATADYALDVQQGAYIKNTRANATTLTVHATNDAYNGTAFLVKSDAASGTGYKDLIKAVINSDGDNSQNSQTIFRVTSKPSFRIERGGFHVRSGGATVNAGGLVVTAAGQTITAGGLKVVAGGIDVSAQTLTLTGSTLAGGITSSGTTR